MTQFIRNPSSKVLSVNRRNWEAEYEKYLAERCEGPPYSDPDMASAASYADAKWEGAIGVKIEYAKPIDRIADAFQIPRHDVKLDQIEYLEAWEEKAERPASPDEVRAVLGGPLLERAQRTIPGAGLPPEVPPVSSDPDEPAAPPKKRGRPPKNRGAPMAAAAPPKPKKQAEAVPAVTGNRKTDREIELKKRAKKAYEPLEAAAFSIAQTLAQGVEPRYWVNVLDLARVYAGAELEKEALKIRLEGDADHDLGVG